MEIFQTIWTALSTQNEELINILSIPLSLIETFTIMLLFTTVLSISITKKQKIIYVFIIFIIANLSAQFFPEIKFIINMISVPLSIMIIFKISFLKSIIAEVISFFSMIISESLFSRLYLFIFNISYDSISRVPIYRITFALIMYIFIYFLYKLAKHFKFNIKILDNINRKNKVLLSVTFVLGIITVFIQNYVNLYYTDIVPNFIVILSTLSLVSFFIMSFYSVSKTTQLELTSQNLEEAQLYNKSLKILHDNVRAFKHDFSNIVQAIGGYVGTDDMDGLKIYYSQLLEDCQKVNNLYTLSPDVINNPAIYSILAAKYHRADELGIKIHLEVFINLNELHMKIYEFTRILGILMDNAIEASKECDEKEINVELRKDFNVNRQLLIIQNTYKEKDVDLDRIFEKGFSSKPNNTGLGLWEVRQILKKNSNLNLYTNKDDKYFLQQLEIY